MHRSGLCHRPCPGPARLAKLLGIHTVHQNNFADDICAGAHNLPRYVYIIIPCFDIVVIFCTGTITKLYEDLGSLNAAARKIDAFTVITTVI